MSVAETNPPFTPDRRPGHPGIHPREKKVSAVPTYAPKAGDTTRSWYVIDATDVVLGRLAVAAANLLRGKHKPTFAPNVDGGDFVIVINADKVAISGDKLQHKMVYRHSGYPGGLHKRTIGELMQRTPTAWWKRRSSACCPRTGSAARSSASFASTPARSIRTALSSRFRTSSSRWRNDRNHPSPANPGGPGRARTIVRVGAAHPDRWAP